ncbi:MAG: hypothetical protein MRY85_19465, partial [Phaeodactylibacter sp.]
MRNHLTFLFLFLFTICAQAQEKQMPVTVKADSLRQAGDLTEAIALYRQGYEQDADDFTNTYNMACAYALLNNRDS